MKLVDSLFPLLALFATALPAQDSSTPVTLLAGQGEFSGAEQVFFEDGQLWLATDVLPAATGFANKPEGLCSEDTCIPLPPDGSWQTRRGEREYIDLTAFADKLGQVLIRDRGQRVWAMAQAPLIRSRSIERALAPDFELPNREGRSVRLSDFRGKKILLLTWASW